MALCETIERLFGRWECVKSQAPDDSTRLHSRVPIVTVSSMTGSRGLEFGKLLSQRLDYEYLTIDHIGLFAEGSEYIDRMSSLLDSRFKSSLPELVESMEIDFSDQANHMKHHCKIVLCLAELGGVVLADWAANYILGPECGLHIRVFCPNSIRARNVATESGLPLNDARKLLRESHNEGYAFLLKQLRYDVWDETQYDVLLNSGYMDFERMVDIAVAASEAKATSISERRVKFLASN